MSAPRTAAGPALLVIVPCRDEALTIGRKLANLALLDWPPSAVPHRVVVVDDGSRDATYELARTVGALAFPPGRADVVELVVVRNDGPGGKPHAIRRGLAEALPGHAIVVLTDADVVVDATAARAVVDAFEREPELAMACGTQRFVERLAPDGTPPADDAVDASTAFDRWSARARALESRRGRLFSVHGQWLAWRAELGLAPAAGIAADDLDLRLQVRARNAPPRRVRLVRGARFHEQKPAPGPAARAQALRRARAWFQALAAREGGSRGGLEGAQWAFYRHAPALAPRLTWMLPALALGGAYLASGRAGLLVGLIALALLATSPPGWRWLRLMSLIAEARRAERATPLPARWETPRA